MWPDSDFAHPVSSYQNPVPVPGINPELAPLITVSFNKKWLPYVVGSLKQLLLQSTWDTSDLSVTDLTQEQAFNLINLFMSATPPTKEVQGIECECENMCCIRYDPSTGHIQTLVCGEWKDIPGYPSGSSSAGQPGNGSPQPAPGGGQACYDLAFPTMGQALIPTLFNTGDQVIVQSSNGAGQDNAAFWWNPDGTQFILGGSYDNIHTDGSDPFPTLRHGALILEINGQAFLAYAGQTITIPSGVVNLPAVIRPNLAIAGGNGGSYQVNLCAVNNQAAHWAHDLDLTISPRGFVPRTVDVGVPGLWASGNGYSDQPFEDPTNNHYEGIELVTSLPAADYTRVWFDYDLTLGQTNPANSGLAIYLNGSAITFKLFSAMANGNGQRFDTGLITAPGTTDIRLDCFSGGDITGTPPSPTGSCRLYNIHVEGTGFDPFA